MWTYKIGRLSFGTWQLSARFVMALMLALAALWAAPAQAQWTNVDNVYWTRQFDCGNPRSCTLFQDNFYAYEGEQVVIHFNPYDAGWWDSWDVDVYVQSDAASFQYRQHNNASKERIFFFDISRSRDFTFTIDLHSTSSNPRGSFEVRVEINSQNPDQRRRARATATPEPRYYLDRNDRVQGTLSDRNRQDRYEFYAEAGDLVTIKMDRTSGELDPLLELYDPRGDRLASNDDSGGNRNALLDEFRVDRAGDFVIVARSYDNASSGGYTLILDVSRPRPTATPQPRYYLDRNDRVSGTLNSGNRQDRYQFRAQAGDSVTIAMNRSSGGLDPYLELLDSRGNRLASNDDSGSNRNALIEGYRVGREGDFVIVARAYNNGSSGSYTLTLTVERARVQRSGLVVDYDCSLFDAIEAANRDRSVGGCPAGRGADTITLTRDTRLNGDLPSIRSDITIQGGGAEISGDGRYRIFVIERGASLSLVNMTIRDGWAPDDGSLNLVGDGGAILNEGSLSMRDCTARNNTSGEDGGAIRNLGSLEIVNGSFIDNAARRQGGAIYSSDGSAEGSDSARLEISGTVFRGNRATRHAGAIFADGWTRILSGVFSHNHADISGGALYNLGTAEIYGSEFVNNSSQKNGGAVFNDYEANITISSSEFRGNSTRDGGGGVMSYGRARADIEQSTFSGNSASRGGGVMVKGFARNGRTFYGEMSLSDSRLSNNRGGDCGIGDYGDLTQSGWNDIGDGGCRRV